MKTYCKSCGHANMYTINKPEKCERCGTSFGLASIISKTHTSKPAVSYRNMGNPFYVVGHEYSGETLQKIAEDESKKKNNNRSSNG